MHSFNQHDDNVNMRTRPATIYERARDAWPRCYQHQKLSSSADESAAGLLIDSASYIDIASYTLPSTVSGDSASACAPMSSSNNNFSCSLSSSNGLRFGTTHTH